MDFNNHKDCIFLTGLLISTLIAIPVIATTNIDCKGKAFHCVNSTHFKICVDFGGVSKTVDDFLIPCPESTVCTDNNYFECEYQYTTTSVAVPAQSEGTNGLFETSVTSSLDIFDVTTFRPIHYERLKLSENSTIKTAVTSELASTVTPDKIKYNSRISKVITNTENIFHNTTISGISESEIKNSKNKQFQQLNVSDRLIATTTIDIPYVDLSKSSASITAENSATESVIWTNSLKTVMKTISNSEKNIESTLHFTTPSSIYNEELHSSDTVHLAVHNNVQKLSKIGNNDLLLPVIGENYPITDIVTKSASDIFELPNNPDVANTSQDIGIKGINPIEEYTTNTNEFYSNVVNETVDGKVEDILMIRNGTLKYEANEISSSLPISDTLTKKTTSNEELRSTTELNVVLTLEGLPREELLTSTMIMKTYPITENPPVSKPNVFDLTITTDSYIANGQQDTRSRDVPVKAELTTDTNKFYTNVRERSDDKVDDLLLSKNGTEEISSLLAISELTSTASTSTDELRFTKAVNKALTTTLEEFSTEETPTVTSTSVINDSYPIIENHKTKSSSHLFDLTTSTDSYIVNVQQDTPIGNVNSKTTFSTSTNQFNTNVVKEIFNDKVEDIYGRYKNGTDEILPLVQNSEFALTVNISNNELHSTTDVNIVLTNTLEEFSTQETPVATTVITNSYLSTENSVSKLLPNIFEATSSTDSYNIGTIQQSAQARNNYAKASNFSKFYTNASKITTANAGNYKNKTDETSSFVTDLSYLITTENVTKESTNKVFSTTMKNIFDSASNFTLYQYRTENSTDTASTPKSFLQGINNFTQLPINLLDPIILMNASLPNKEKYRQIEELSTTNTALPATDNSDNTVHALTKKYGDAYNNWHDSEKFFETLSGSVDSIKSTSQTEKEQNSDFINITTIRTIYPYSLFPAISKPDKASIPKSFPKKINNFTDFPINLLNPIIPINLSLLYKDQYKKIEEFSTTPVSYDHLLSSTNTAQENLDNIVHASILNYSDTYNKNNWHTFSQNIYETSLKAVDSIKSASERTEKEQNSDFKNITTTRTIYPYSLFPATFKTLNDSFLDYSTVKNVHAPTKSQNELTTTNIFDKTMSTVSNVTNIETNNNLTQVSTLAPSISEDVIENYSYKKELPESIKISDSNNFIKIQDINLTNTSLLSTEKDVTVTKDINELLVTTENSISNLVITNKNKNTTKVNAITLPSSMHSDLVIATSKVTVNDKPAYNTVIPLKTNDSSQLYAGILPVNNLKTDILTILNDNINHIVTNGNDTTGLPVEISEINNFSLTDIDFVTTINTTNQTNDVNTQRGIPFSEKRISSTPRYDIVSDTKEEFNNNKFTESKADKITSPPIQNLQNTLLKTNVSTPLYIKNNVDLIQEFNKSNDKLINNITKFSKSINNFTEPTSGIKTEINLNIHNTTEQLLKNNISKLSLTSSKNKSMNTAKNNFHNTYNITSDTNEDPLTVLTILDIKLSNTTKPHKLLNSKSSLRNYHLSINKTINTTSEVRKSSDVKIDSLNIFKNIYQDILNSTTKYNIFNRSTHLDIINGTNMVQDIKLPENKNVLANKKKSVSNTPLLDMARYQSFLSGSSKTIGFRTTDSINTKLEKSSIFPTTTPKTTIRHKEHFNNVSNNYKYSTGENPNKSYYIFSNNTREIKSELNVLHRIDENIQTSIPINQIIKNSYNKHNTTFKEKHVNNNASDDYNKKMEHNTKRTSYYFNRKHVMIPKDNKKISKLRLSCINHHRGKYSVKNDCQNFYICIGRNEPIFGKCPNTTVFSEILKQCTKNLSHCIRNNQFQCVSVGRFVDILSEQFYYICVKRTGGFIRFKFQCQKGYHLNKTKLQCVLDSLNGSMSNEDSSKSDNEKSTTESKSKELRDSRSKKMNFECKQEGKFFYPDDCRKYYQCTKIGNAEFRRKIKKCDSDEIYNEEKKKCVEDDSYECNE